jgi:hypothetical protein
MRHTLEGVCVTACGCIGSSNRMTVLPASACVHAGLVCLYAHYINACSLLLVALESVLAIWHAFLYKQ